MNAADRCRAIQTVWVKQNNSEAEADFMMKRIKITAGLLAVVIITTLAAGCGANEKAAAPQPQAGQVQASGHEGHSAAMPKEDPMPIMKELDKALQDVVKQVRAGQTMEAQKSVAQLVSITNKVLPHMMDTGLKDKLRTGAAELKDSVNTGKVDPNALEKQAKSLQELLKQTADHLQTMSH